jgi:hypothetical protein
MTLIRISYVRATFAAGLLAGVRSSLLKITDLLGANVIWRGSRAGGPVITAACPTRWTRPVSSQRRCTPSGLLMRYIAKSLSTSSSTTGSPGISGRKNCRRPRRRRRHRRSGRGRRCRSRLVCLRTHWQIYRTRLSYRRRGPASQSGCKEIGEDLDDAIKAINWARNVRFQTEISDATTNLREWAALSAASFAEGS